MANTYSWVQYRKEMKLPDGIYNGLYNKEPSVIRLQGSEPVWVQFIGFMKHYDGVDKRCDSCIYAPSGILHSSVELLLPAQEL